DEQRAREAEEPRRATDLLRAHGDPRERVETQERDERDRPRREEERDLHPAPERPVERAHAEDDRRKEIGREPSPVVARVLDEETPRGEKEPEDRARRDDRRPHHEAATGEAGE